MKCVDAGFIFAKKVLPHDCFVLFSAAKGEPSRAVQRPEDFMDAEDLGDFGIAPQGLKTSAQFSKVKPAEEVRKRKREELSEATAIPGEPVEFDELFRPVTETVGVNLLKGMGWRQGQGIGPRLSARQKARQAEANKRMFGCPLPASQQDKTESDEDDEGVDPKYRVGASTFLHRVVQPFIKHASVQVIIK